MYNYVHNLWYIICFRSCLLSLLSSASLLNLRSRYLRLCLCLLNIYIVYVYKPFSDQRYKSVKFLSCSPHFFPCITVTRYTRLLWPLKVLIMIGFDQFWLRECVLFHSIRFLILSLKLHAITKSKCENPHKDLIADQSDRMHIQNAAVDRAI